MGAGGTLTLPAGATDYLFSKTEVWSGIVGNGTRGVVLESIGNTLSVIQLDHIVGGRNAPGSPIKDVVTLLPTGGGSTITVQNLETLYGSTGQDLVRTTSTGTTMAVEGIETFLGATSGTNLIVLTSTAGNTMSVGYLKSIIGSAGKDVITFGAGGQVGSTAAVTLVETLIGTAGDDLFATVGGGSNTVSLTGIELFLGNGSGQGDVITLAGGGTIGVSYVETVIGSSARDVVTYGYRLGSVDQRTGGGTVSVSGVEVIVGGTGSKNTAILLDQGNTVTVASLNTLIGGGGNDVVQLTMLDGTPIVGTGPVLWNTVGNTMMVSMLETIIGTSGQDAIISLNNGGGTLSVSAVETLVGRGGTEVILLDESGNTVAVSGLETLIGGQGQDVVGLTNVSSLSGTTMQVSGIETLLGGTGNDVIVLSDTAGTIFVSDVETLYLAQTGQTLDVTGQTREVVFPFSVTAPSAPSAPSLATVSDTGLQGDLLTGSAVPTLTGTAAAGSVINLYGAPPNAATVLALGSGTADTAGLWSITTGTVLTDGAWTLMAKSVASGTESNASAPLFLTIDTAAPAAPTLGLAPGSDTGASAADGITNLVQPTLMGSAEASSTVTLYDGTLVVGTATADGGGTWSIVAPTLAAGTHTLTAFAVDAAGNTGTASSQLSVTVDTEVAAPSLALSLASDTGIAGDNLTAVNTPVIAGSAEAFAVISLIENGASLGSASADASGQWQLTLGSLAEGPHTLTASAVDRAGNTSALSGSLTVTIDTTPPAAPSVPALAPASDTGLSNSDRLTGIAAPTFTGSAEAGSVIDLLVGGSAVGTGTASGAGLWTITSSTLGEGTQTISARARDAAGNVRDGGDITVTIDLTGPLAPSGIGLTAVTDSGVQGDGVTNVAAPTLMGSAEAGSTIRLYEGATALGTALANGQGLWEIAPGNLGDGRHTLTARAEDAAGNTGSASAGFVVTIDRSVATPTGLALTIASDTGDAGDGITNLAAPAIRGVAEAGNLVRLYEGQTLLGSGTADGQGAWTVSSSVLTDGGYSLTAVAIDPAGNTSAASAELAVTLDLVAPAAPFGLALDGASDSGTVGDGLTHHTAPVITGSAERGSRIALYDGNALIGAGTADAISGLWSVQAVSALIEGPHTLTAIATDRAGNTGTVSTGLAVTIDTTAPAIGTPTADADGVAPTITGTAEAGSVVTLYSSPSGGAVLGTATAGPAGAWSIKTPDLAPATYTLAAQAMDAAGNVGSSQLTLTLAGRQGTPGGLALAPGSDSGADLGDRITGVAAPTITGTALAGAVITLYDNGTTTAVGTTTADTSGAWAITAAVLGDGIHVLRAMGQDGTAALGISTPLTITIDTTAPEAGGLALQAASDTGASSSDRITRATNPVVTGTAEAGSLVTLYDSDRAIVVGQATSAADGTWSATTTLGAGVHTLTAQAVDVAGNTGSVSAGLPITVDTAAAAPAILTLADDLGTGGSHLTRLIAPTLSGSAEAGSSVALYAGGQLVGTASADLASGAWTVGAAALGDGMHTLTAQIVDRAGNTSLASSDFVLSIDSTAPAAPATPTFSADTGTPGDGVTREQIQTFTGTAEAGSLVTLYDNGTALADVTADATSGVWSVANVTLAAGLHALTVRAADVAGNTGASSAALALTIDLASDAPSNLALAAGSDTGLSANDRVTRASALTLTGSAEAASSVILYDGGTSNPIGTVQADGTGAWSFTLTGAAEGAHTFTATAIDPAGNTSAASAALTVTVDRTIAAPLAPALDAGSDTGASAADHVTRLLTPTLTGTVEAGAQVSLYEATALVGVTTADHSGVWRISQGLAEGTHALSTRVIDTAGNSADSTSSLTVTIDATAPGAPSVPTLAAASDTGALSSDRITRIATPVLTGSAEAGSTVLLYDGAAPVGTVAADTLGAWTLTTASLADGIRTLTAQSVDLAGNTSATSAALMVTIDTTSPSAPVVTSAALTNSTTPTLTGTAEADSFVTVTIGGATYVTTATGGAWSLDLANATPVSGALSLNLNGSNVVSVSATDTAGNTSSAGTQSLVIDTIAPTTPAVTSAALTNSTTPTLTGTAETGSSVTITVGGATYATTATGGAWSLDLATATPTTGSLSLNPNGSNTVSATATDAAGNTSPAGTQSLVIDTTAPTTPAVTSAALTNSATPTLTGTAEGGSTVTVTVGGATYVTTATGGAWSLDLASATPVSGTLSLNLNGSNAVSVSATDVAGNTSSAGTQSLVIDTIAPTTPAVTSAALTNSTTPTLTGTAETGSSVTVTVGGATYATTATGGTWSLDLATATPVSGTLNLNPNGSNAVSVSATDAAGNTSSAGTQSLVIDTTMPTTPAVTSAALTNSTTPTLTGTAEMGSSVKVTVGGATYTTTATSGTWSLDLATATPTNGSLSLNPNGINAISATATDAAGNTSPAGTQSLVIDTSAPAAPAVTSAALTNSATPTLTGTAEGGSTVTVTVGGATYVTTATSGTWSLDLATATPASGTLNLNPNGSNAVSVSATDAVGNTSSAGTQSLVIDTTAPTTPAITSAVLTNSTTPILTGMAEGGSTVTVTVGGATYATTATSGTWSLDLATATPASGTLNLNPNGSNAVSVSATDAAGNVSAAGMQTLVIDTAAPGAPAITSAALTSSAAPILTGTAETGSSVTVTVGGATYATTATGGTWSLDLATAAPTTGSLSLNPNDSNAVSATATDAAGNTSSAGTQMLVIDTTTPSAPVVTNAALTNSTTPTLTGTAEGGSTVTVTVGGATYTTIVTGGAWSLDLAVATPVTGTLSLNPNGPNAVSATATDAAGNTSSAGTQSLVIDTIAPTATVLFEDGSIDAVEQRSSAFVIDSAEAGAAFTWSITSSGGGRVTGSGVTTASTTRVSGLDLSSLSDGTLLLAVRMTDPAGNASAPVTAQTLKLTTPDPITPVIPPETVTIDGATVNTEVVTDMDGSRIATVAIMATNASRIEDTSTAHPDLADVPVVRETVVDPRTGQPSNVTTLTVSVPTGVGVVATGSAERQTASQAQIGLAGLIASIEARTDDGTASRAGLTNGGLGFLAELSSQTQLLVRAIDISAPGVSPGQPVEMRVSGNALGGTGTGSTMPTALVIDTTAVSGPVTIWLDDIEFVAVIGNAKLVGGNGKQIVYADAGAQYLYLGADDDILHGGDGNDTVASASGNDMLFGDDGDDRVSGGEGNDSLFGGTGNDTVFGELGDDALFGEDGDDVLDGGAGNDIVEGGAGDDTIVNSPGDDILLGGRSLTGPTGTDTLVFNSRLADTTVTRDGAYTLIIGPEGQDRITGFERHLFTDATVVTADGAPLVDDLYYLADNKDVFQAGQDADDHYATYGWKEGRDPNLLFSTSGYLAANPDVQAAGINPLQHYDAYGWKESRDPSANFDNELYLAHNPDVKAAGLDPLKHYIEYGQGEGRQIYDAIGRTTDLAVHPGFDAEYYLLTNTDVARAATAAGGNTYSYAYAHYQLYGWKEGRNPNAVFDTKGYLNAYQDVKAAGIDPLMHYDQYGWKEGRDPSKGFDTTAYLSAYGDVAQAKLNPMQHYLQYGAVEGRSTFGDTNFGGGNVG